MPVQICLKNTLDNVSFFAKITAILKRQIEERCGTIVQIEDSAAITLIFELQKGLDDEGYSIEGTANNKIQIIGQNYRGLLYGLGKFLHSSNYLSNNFIPSKWRGKSHPECSLRAMYFATHFFNFYHVAPIERIQWYIEDLALWGFNTIIVWYDMHHFSGIKDPNAVKYLARLKEILKKAKDLELQAGIGLIANEGYSTSPRELRADQSFPGTRHIRGGYGVELCPSKPGATELVLNNFRDEFEVFKDINLDYLMVWPYDQGGCCCNGCRPWGANGFLNMAPKIASLARQFFSNIKIILSTWLFDPNGIDEGEWVGLSKRLMDHPNWVDFILADSHTNFPKYPLERSPGKFPLINFPEISMWNMIPWGGYGANPLPMRFQGFWNAIKDKISGGIPYSEGIFEDLNKIIWSQFYWKKQSLVEEILEEYCKYEFPGCNCENLIDAIKILEKNHVSFKLKKVPKQITDSGSERALEIFQSINNSLPQYIQQSWRWRILYLRAIIDFERFQGRYYPNQTAKKVFEELTQIYFAQFAEYSVRPHNPKLSWLKKTIMRLSST